MIPSNMIEVHRTAAYHAATVARERVVELVNALAKAARSNESAYERAYILHDAAAFADFEVVVEDWLDENKNWEKLPETTDIQV